MEFFPVQLVTKNKKTSIKGIFYCEYRLSFFEEDILLFPSIIAAAYDLTTLRPIWDHNSRLWNGLINTLLHTASIMPFYEHFDETRPFGLEDIERHCSTLEAIKKLEK